MVVYATIDKYKEDFNAAKVGIKFNLQKLYWPA